MVIGRKFTAVVREMLERDLQCPTCGAENVPGKGGRHIHVDEHGLAVCTCCLSDFRPEVSAR